MTLKYSENMLHNFLLENKNMSDFYEKKMKNHYLVI